MSTITVSEAAQSIDQFKTIIGQIPEDRSMSMMFQLMFDMLKLLCTEEITAGNFSYALDRMTSQSTIANKHDPMRDNAFRNAIYALGESLHCTTRALVNKRLIRGPENCDEAVRIPDDQFMNVIIDHCITILKTIRSKKLIIGNFDMLLESMAVDREVTAKHDVMRDSPLRKLVYALSEAIEMTVNILLEKNRPTQAAGVHEPHLPTIKAEPVIEEDWSFSDATEPMRAGSGGDMNAGVILESIVDDADDDDVQMIGDDDRGRPTDDADDASIHILEDAVMTDNTLEEEESVAYVDEVKPTLFEMKDPDEIKVEEVDEEEDEARENFLDFSHHHHQFDEDNEEEDGARHVVEEEEEQEEKLEDEEVKEEGNESQDEDDEQQIDQADRRSRRAKSVVRLKNDLAWNMVGSSPALSQAKTARKSRQLSCKACGHISQTNRQADNHRLECTGNVSKALRTTQDKTISKKGTKSNTMKEQTPKIGTKSVETKSEKTPKTPKTSKTCRRRSLTSSKSWKRSCGGYFKMPPAYCCTLCEDETLRPLRGLICHFSKGHQADKKNVSAFLNELRFECVCGFAADEVHQCYDHEKTCDELKEGSFLLYRSEIDPKITANQVRPKYTCRCKFTTETKADVWKHKDKCTRSFFTVQQK